MPFSILAERLDRRREFLVGFITIMGLAVLALAVVSTDFIWIPMLFIGAIFDAYMGLHQAVTLSIKDLDYKFAGISLGLVLTLRQTGAVICVPIGNLLASRSLNAPFVFWGFLALIGAIILLQLPRRHPETAM